MIPQKHIKAGEGWPFRRSDIFFKGDNAWRVHFESRGADWRIVIFSQHIDLFQKDSLNSIAPGPKRQWKVTQRPEIGVQDQSSTIIKHGSQSPPSWWDETKPLVSYILGHKQ